MAAGLAGAGVAALGAGAFGGGIWGAVGGGLAGGVGEGVAQLLTYGNIRNPQLIGVAMLSGVTIGGAVGAIGYGIGQRWQAAQAARAAATDTSTVTGIRGAPAGAGTSGGPTAGKSITPAERAPALSANKAANPRGNYWCTNCGYENTDPTHFDIDHIIPKSQGGNTDSGNLRVLCIGCNRSAQEGWPPKPGSDWATKHSDWNMKP